SCWAKTPCAIFNRHPRRVPPLPRWAPAGDPTRIAHLPQVRVEHRHMNLRNLDRRELAAALAPLGIGGQVAGRIFSAVHRDPVVARELKARRRAGGAAALETLPTAKYTLCVSSQVGCALACDFCATGRLGGIRSLQTWEILAQHRLVAAEADHPVRGVVFMG